MKLTAEPAMLSNSFDFLMKSSTCAMVWLWMYRSHWRRM